MTLEWEEKFMLGHPEMDAQHTKIFQMLTDLRVAIQERRGAEEVVRVLSSVTLFVMAHFSLEENLMCQAAYPDQARHMDAHDQVRAQVDHLVDRFHQTGVAAEELLIFLDSWLSGHVLVEDKPLVDFLAAKGRAAGPEISAPHPLQLLRGVGIPLG